MTGAGQYYIGILVLSLSLEQLNLTNELNPPICCVLGNVVPEALDKVLHDVRGAW